MAPSRGAIINWIRPAQHLCRSMTTSAVCLSGHSRWSKIKHDKGKADISRSKQFIIYATQLTLASRMHGSSPDLNPRLADLITKCKREGYPKASIESAIARGQGRSASGASLETITFEALMPNNVGMIMEVETDSRPRTLQNIRSAIKKAGGNSTPSAFLFEKKGRVVFEAKDGVSMEQALDSAVEAGALDVDESEDGQIIVYTEPDQISNVGSTMADTLGLEIVDSAVVHEPKPDTVVQLPDARSATELCAFIDGIDDGNVQSIAMNIEQGSLDAESWAEVSSRL